MSQKLTKRIIKCFTDVIPDGNQKKAFVQKFEQPLDRLMINNLSERKLINLSTKMAKGCLTNE